jgi:RNA polymerase sigma factor (sigma-70 family)
MPQVLTRSLDRVRATLVCNDETELSDGQLLSRFLDGRDGDAFAALVRRHGPMVLGVCRRIVGDAHEAEDAFQATFLVLARRAGAVVPRERVGGWLYGVAVRTAREARSMRLRRTAKVAPQAELPEPAAKSADPDCAELRLLLDRELERLPEHYRLPVVLCELEGRSRQEVARQLRIPEGTLSSRLAKARRLLARRLKQRGLALPASALALSVAADAAAACPPELIGSTVRAALPYAAGQAAGLSPSVAALCQGVSKILFLARLRQVAFALTAILLLAGLGGSLLLVGAEEPRPAPNSEKKDAAAPDKQPPPARPKEGRLVIWRQNVRARAEARLQLVSPDGKETAWLLEGVKHAERPGCRIVALSPDGTQVAYGVPNNPESNGAQGPLTIHIKSVADKKPGRSLKVEALCLAWSPDGKELAVSRFIPPPGSTRPTGVESAIVDVQTGESKPLTLPAVKLPDGAESDRHVITDWSRNGEWFLTEVARPPNPPGKSYLFRVKRDGSKAEPVIVDRAALRGRFSPDGKWVLFYGADDDGRNLHLYTAEVGKGKPWLVSKERNDKIMGFCWSPDGKRIAYTAQVFSAEGPGGETESFLIVVDADGKNPVTLLSEKADNAGSTTVDGVDWR